MGHPTFATDRRPWCLPMDRMSSSATVAEFGEKLSPNSATSRQGGQSFILH